MSVPSVCNLFAESVVVGIALLALVYFVSWAFRWVALGRVPSALVIVLSGALFHVIAELIGLNRQFCLSRVDCLIPK